MFWETHIAQGEIGRVTGQGQDEDHGSKWVKAELFSVFFKTVYNG